jgi:hypothetical protein
MRRGQAALEFLTTYGWAFLVILVMIGAISYFGILKPTKLLPSRCSISPEFNCVDYKIDNTGLIQMQFKQGVGKTIFLNNVTCSYESTTVTGRPSPSPAGAALSWSPRTTIPLNCTIPAVGLLRSQKVKVTFDITYQKSVTGLTHVTSGELFSEVQ